MKDEYQENEIDKEQQGELPDEEIEQEIPEPKPIKKEMSWVKAIAISVIILGFIMVLGGQSSLMISMVSLEVDEPIEGVDPIEATTEETTETVIEVDEPIEETTETGYGSSEHNELESNSTVIII